jgi:hypothetical protein
MEGGLSATYPMDRYGLNDGLALLGFGPTKDSKGNRYIYQEEWDTDGRLGTESLQPSSLRPRLCSSSSLCSLGILFLSNLQIPHFLSCNF